MKRLGEPVGLELPFGGSEPESLLPFELQLAGRRTALLGGRIDRVDRYIDDQGRILVRVVDYKSSPQQLSLSDVHDGLRMQLMLYLMAILRRGAGLVGGTPEPAGALYFPIQDPIVLVDGPGDMEQAERKYRAAFKTRGLIVEDVSIARAMDVDLEGRSDLVPVQLKRDGTLATSPGNDVATAEQLGGLFRHVERTAARLAEQVLDGEVATTPYQRTDRTTPCATCTLRSVCQFDPTVGRLGYRRLPTLERDEVWRRVLNPAVVDRGGSS